MYQKNRKKFPPSENLTLSLTLSIIPISHKDKIFGILQIIGKIFADYAFEQSPFKKGFATMNKVTKQKVETSVE